MSQKWDYIIIGGGTAGSILANRLSANPKNQVLLLEAGGEDRHASLRIPAGVVSAVFSDTYNWKYPAKPDRSRNGIEDSWSGGKVLGGSSSINGMLFMRGAPSDYDRWAQLGCKGWDYSSVLPHFKSIESFESGPDDYRGGDGPVSVTLPVHFPPIARAVVDAAQECGHPLNEDYNAESSEGVGLAQSTIQNGKRHSAARAFLAPVRNRPNLEVRINAHVERVMFENGRANCVEYRWKGKVRKAVCDQEVIISAGAIGSPKILMHSGIGPAELLREYGIPIVHNSPLVGENLMEHPGVYVSADTRLPTFNSSARPHVAPFVLLNWLLRGRGPAAVGTALAQILCRSDLSLDGPDLQILLSLAKFSIKPDGKSVALSKTDGISLACCLLDPNTRGTVRINSPDPLCPPQVSHELVGDAADVEKLALTAKRALAIVAALQETGVVSNCNFPLSATAPLDEWSDLLSNAAFRADHPSGTCAMGAKQNDVLDAKLRVRGVTRLRVVDASIMPRIPMANTNASVMMIAEKASSMILE